MKDFEMDTRRTGTTHLFMDTPFRNMNVLAEWIYDPSYIEYVKKTEEGSKLF